MNTKKWYLLFTILGPMSEIKFDHTLTKKKKKKKNLFLYNLEA